MSALRRAVLQKAAACPRLSLCLLRLPFPFVRLRPFGGNRSVPPCRDVPGMKTLFRLSALAEETA